MPNVNPHAVCKTRSRRRQCTIKPPRTRIPTRGLKGRS
jgi:hypothetical protein